MAIHLEDYQELLSDLPSPCQQGLRDEWHDATRALSSRGLDGDPEERGTWARLSAVAVQDENAEGAVAVFKLPQT